MQKFSQKLSSKHQQARQQKYPQKSSQNLAPNQSAIITPHNSHSLEHAFSEFNDYANQLSTTYQALNAQVKQLSQELSEERDKRHKQLAETERYTNRLTQLLSELPAGVLVLDVRGCVQQCNPAAIELLGEPLEGELWRHIIDRVFEPMIHTGQESRLKDGRMVSMSTCPLGNEPGQIILLMDVTETRFLQQSLERHQRLSAMGEMSAKVAHQIRTPLASALLYVSNLSQEKISQQEKDKFLAKALSRLQHLENVVEDMLSFSRVGDIGQDLVALSYLGDELQAAMETHLESTNNSLEISNLENDTAICANRDAMLGILQNLVSNAIQAIGSNGIIKFYSRPVDQHQGIPSIDLVLEDNGPGISNNDLEKIFDPFFTTRSHGTGLGLSVAKAVVENHGGSIWVERCDQQGTVFVIRLPIIKDTDLNGLCLSRNK